MKCSPTARSNSREGLELITTSVNPCKMPKSFLENLTSNPLIANSNNTNNKFTLNGQKHSMKSVYIWSYSGLHFPAFGLNTERYLVFLRIQSEYWKMRTRITLNTDTFNAVKLLGSCVLQYLLYQRSTAQKKRFSIKDVFSK